MATKIINLANLNGSNGFRMDGTREEAQAGRSVSNAGDVNGDGYADVIVSSDASYIVFGKAAGFDATLNLSSIDGSNGFRLDGPTGDLSGRPVSNAGDINGDGFDDVVIGSNKNGSFVVFGKASGFDAVLDLSGLDGNNGFFLDGAATDDTIGRSVSNAGDINGDGFDDVIVSALDSAYPPVGSSYVVFGKSDGFGATLDLSSLDGSNGFHLDGAAAYGTYSISVSSAGDVNNDGFDDVIMGARGAPNSGFSGSSYVVFGKASGFDATLDLSSLDGNDGFRLDSDRSSESVSSAGDVNGDGFDDVIIGINDGSFVVFGKESGFNATLDLSSLDGKNGFRINDGLSTLDLFGLSVSNAGDINGDGFGDVIIGANLADPNGISAAGSSYVVFGKASGFEATVDLSNLDSNGGFRLDGVATFDASGASVSGAGDINNDGFDDLIVGARGASANGIDDAGASYVIFGRSDFGGGLPEILGTPGDNLLKGTSAAEHFKAGGGNDNLIGRGGADIFEGEAGNDKINVADLNFASVDGGTGNDILHLDGKGLDLDLTDFHDKIQGIETICLYGRGDNSLTLSGSELLSLSDTSNTLKLHGNAGDQVILEGNWVDEGSHGFYHTYTLDDAVVLVGMNMTAVIA